MQATVGRHRRPDGWVHWIEVSRQRGYEPLSHEGRVFVLRGRASVTPSPSQLADLYNLFGYIITEERAIAAAGLEAIDLQSFRAYLERQGLELTEGPQPAIEDDLKA